MWRRQRSSAVAQAYVPLSFAPVVAYQFDWSQEMVFDAHDRAFRFFHGACEHQVGTVRERFFVPRLRFAGYEEMNAWLLDQCVAYARRHPHPEFNGKTVWPALEEERPSLVAYRGPFDGFHATPVSVSKTCLVRFDGNR